MSGGRLDEGDPEELIECPFDPVHLLRRKRMPYHIIKCGKNFNRKDFKVCPFNYRHIVAKDGLEAHIDQCPDRGILEREMLHVQQQFGLASELVPMQKGYTEVPVSTFVPPEPEESWDSSNVVVDIVPPGGNGLFSRDEVRELPNPAPPHVQVPHNPSPPRVREPPNPRKPVVTGASGAEMFDLVTTQVKPVGRGRGRGTMISSPKVGGTALLGNKSPSPVQAPPGMGLGPRKSVGRGRGAMLQSHAQSTRFAEVEAERKKKEKKLKKMLRQILELEEKVEEGQPLNEDQVAKLSRKEDVLSMLQQMQV